MVENYYFHYQNLKLFKMKSKNALIIGANSQDGKYLSNFLLKKNYKVFVIFNKNKKKINKKLVVSRINLNKKYDIKNFLSRFDSLEIYYFPSINIDSGQKETKKVFIKNLDLNFLKLNNLLSSMAKLKNKKKFKLFYSCSSHIFKSSNLKIKQTEKSQIKVNSYYGFSKLCGLRLCEFYRDNFNLCVFVGILYSHFSQYSKISYVIPKIYDQLKKSKTIKVNNANSKIDFLHVNQVIKIIHKITQLNKPNTFIISSGRLEKINKIFNSLTILMKKKNAKLISVLKNEDTRGLSGNIDKLKKFIKINDEDLSLNKNLKDFIYG